MSRRGICHIWFRGRHISPSMPYREARSVAESSEGPTASKSDCTGRNPGMTRLIRGSSAGSALKKYSKNAVWPSGGRSGDPGFKTRSDHSLNLILVVPGSTS